MINITHAERTSTASPQVTQEHGSVLVSGSSGLVGQALLRRLQGFGHPITQLVRSNPSPDSILWDPLGGPIDPSLIKARAVVHLAGENIADGRWTKSKMKAIRDSRAKGTKVLAESLSRMENPPSVLVSASAVGFYGDGGEDVLTEKSSMGSGFLPEVCQEWERATDVARDAGIRVVNLRIGVVLARDGGALKKMLPPFKLGLGGRIGDGRQFMSWILLDDLVSVICEALDNPELSGPVNATAPSPVRNSEFTKSLGKVLHRPTIAPMPGFAARAVFGRMADDLLLSSLRVYPEKLMETGFQFQQPQLIGALQEVLGAPQ